MNKNMKSVLFTVLGVLLCAAGILIVKRFALGSQSAPYVCLGLGCGVFGQGLGELLTRRREKRTRKQHGSGRSKKTTSAISCYGIGRRPAHFGS